MVSWWFSGPIFLAGNNWVEHCDSHYPHKIFHLSPVGHMGAFQSLAPRLLGGAMWPILVKLQERKCIIFSQAFCCRCDTLRPHFPCAFRIWQRNGWKVHHLSLKVRMQMMQSHLLTQDGHIELLREKARFFQVTEIWGLYVATAQLGPAMLMQMLWMKKITGSVDHLSISFRAKMWDTCILSSV